MGLYFDSFLEYIKYEKRFSVHTSVAYEGDLKQFFTYLDITYQITDISEVNHALIRSWLVELMEQKISGRSIARKITTLKSYYKYLLRMGHVVLNPMLKVQAPKLAKTLPVYVEKDNMNSLFETTDFGHGFGALRDRLIMELFYSTGMRLSELVNLTTNDIDTGNCTIKVLGKRSKERIIPYTLQLKKQLEEYIGVREKIETETNRLFIAETGKAVYQKLIYRIVQKYIGRVTTLTKKSPHVLRHTFATHMLNNGAEINSIKEILGHSNLSATQIYTHNTIDRLKNIHKQAHPKA